jgi:hypothetical protein
MSGSFILSFLPVYPGALTPPRTAHSVAAQKPERSVDDGKVVRVDCPRSLVG